MILLYSFYTLFRKAANSMHIREHVPTYCKKLLQPPVCFASGKKQPSREKLNPFMSLCVCVCVFVWVCMCVCVCVCVCACEGGKVGLLILRFLFQSKSSKSWASEMPGSQAVLLSPLIGGVGPKSLVLHLDDLDGSAPQREFEPTKSRCKIAGTKQTCSKEHFNMSFAFKTNEKRLVSLPGASAILVPLGGGEDKQGGMPRGCTDHLAMNTIE